MLWPHSIILTAQKYTWSSSAYTLIVKPGGQRLKTNLFRKTHLIIWLFNLKIKKKNLNNCLLFCLILFFFYKKNRSQNIYLMTTTKKIYCIIKVTDRTTILQIIIWFCKWYHDLMFFNSLYKIVVSIYTKLSRYIKVYSIMLYQIPKKTWICLHWKLILWKGLSWTHYSKLYFALSNTKAWIL